jgi:hypothetical protein
LEGDSGRARGGDRPADDWRAGRAEARGAASAHPGWWWAALASQVPGLLAERWLFFAQARHPQNLYYQTVS